MELKKKRIDKTVTRQGILSICSQLTWGAQGFIAFAIAGSFLPQKEFGFVVICNAILFGGQCLLFGSVTNPTLRFGAVSSKSLNATYGVYLIVTALVCSTFVFLSKELGGIFSTDQDFITLIKFLSIPFATVCLFSVQKIVFFAKMRYKTVLLMDILFTVGNIATLLFFLISGMLSSAVFYYTARSIGALFGLIPFFFIYLWLRNKSPLKSEDQFDYGQYFQHSKYSLVSMVGGFAQGQVDTLAVAYYLNPLSAAIYGAAKIFYTGLTMVTNGLVMVVLPGTSKIVTSGNGKLANYYRHALFLAYIILLPGIAVLVLFPDFLLRLFFAGRYPEAVPIIRIFCLAAFIMPISSITDAVANGAGWFRTACLAAITGSLIGIIASLNLTRIWGISGAAFAPILALFGSSLVIAPIIWRKLKIM
ncbi:oligosaccharide flippase family protein [Acidobacteriota bacterium]